MSGSDPTGRGAMETVFLASDALLADAAHGADPGEQGTLVDLLDRLLDRGVVVVGDLRISVAEVDLLFVGLKLFLSSIDTIEDARADMARRWAEEARL